ncbi:MAG: hypothetical protein N4A35_05505 [Flavobacteriales bacterium]|nr:hypothetical protein [Flavobacteriales bacterium]
MVKNTKEFKELIQYNKEVLKKGYEAEVKKASNKAYAKKYYQRILFIENELTPYYTLLLKELKFVYYHYSALDNQTSFEKTLQHFQQIRDIAQRELLKLIAFKNGNDTIQLSDYYYDLILDSNIDVDDIIIQETKALDSSDENILGALAISIAGKQLHAKYNTSTSNVNKKDEKKQEHRYTFTQKQQLLALYFLLESFGFKTIGTVDLTKQAALYHLILGVPFQEFEKLKNTNIYKALRTAPQVVTNDRYLLKNLELIKPYFQSVQLTNVVALIDQQIDICKENLQNN